jgi:hypothetical protein
MFSVECIDYMLVSIEFALILNSEFMSDKYNGLNLY